MLSTFALPLDVSLFSYAACAGRRNTHGSATLRGVLLAQSRARRPVHTRTSSTLERSYSTTSEESNASTSTFASTSSTTSSSSPSATSPSSEPSSASGSSSTSPIFQFLLSVSFLGKPAHPDDPTSYSFTFSNNSPVKLWRDAQLKQHGRDWKGKGKNREHDAGDDFWFLDKHANKESEVTGIASHSAAFGVADGT